MENARRALTSPSFDPHGFLAAQVGNEVTVDAADLERNLFSFFDKLSTEYSDLSSSIEDEISVLQQSALSMESFLLEELDEQLDKLIAVERVVDEVKEDFQLASDGAVRVGNRLANTEKERLNIRRSIEIMKLVKDFQSSPEDMYANVMKMSANKLRDLLPEVMRTQDWTTISKMLYDLKKVLSDINSEEVQRAQQVVINISEVVEMELLGQFDVLLDDLMENQNNTEVAMRARALAECLHLFNNGQSLHKRYIFSVVEKRIPSDALLERNRGKDSMLMRVKKAISKQRRRIKLPPGLEQLGVGQHLDIDSEGEDSDSSAGASFHSGDDDRSNSAPRDSPIPFNQGSNSGDGSMALMDNLSRLFSMINRVSVEQFAIIRKVFPLHTIPRVTRQLIQRIFNDPAFGIQARVDGILKPQPPAPALSLADYLDALVTVREKLSGLNVLLLECAADASMMGMGSEVISMRKAKKETGPKAALRSHQRDERPLSIEPGRSNSPAPNGSNTALDSLAELYLEDQGLQEEKLKSDAEIREFFFEQTAQVLAPYLLDYFDKELTHVRNQYVQGLRKAVDDFSPNGKVSAGTVLQLPQFRAEKMKSVKQIVATVANKKFLNSVFSVTTDAVTRMESIGRDDKKLPQFVKDLFLLQMGYLVEGVIGPWSKAIIMTLLKVAGSKPQSSTLPPMEVLPALVALCHGRHKIATHYSEVFQRPLSVSPNLVTACKDAKRSSFNQLKRSANETIFAWTLGVAAHLDKVLLSLQGKYDYNPVFDGLTAAAAVAVAAAANAATAGKSTRFNFSPISSSAPAFVEPSNACDAVCKAFIQVTNVVRMHETDMVDIDLNTLFWRPFGQLFVGILISHLRRQLISMEGSRQLRRDLEEYRHVTALMSSAETSDMISCLEEICVIYEAPSGEEVFRIVTEDLRHLDTSVVLSLVKVRNDFQNVLTGGISPWAKALSAQFLNYKWDTALPWEGRKPVTIVAFREAMSSGAIGQKLGPKSLRRSGQVVPNAYLVERLRHRSLLPPPKAAKEAQEEQAKGSRVISLDLRALATGRDTLIDKHIKDAEKAAREEQGLRWQQEENSSVSRFLPSRPDQEADGQTNRQSMTGNGSANGTTGRRGSAKGMLASIDQQRNSMAGTTNRQSMSSSSTSSTANAGAPGTPTSSSVKGMFSKVTSFFGKSS